MSKSLTEQELLEKHAAAVYNLALRLTRNPADAEDLAQDALIRALKGLASFRGDSSASTWIFRITMNTWKNRVRFESRRGGGKTVSLDGASPDPEADPPSVAGEPGLDARLEGDELEKAVQNSLMSMDAESRAILLLRDFEGMAYEDISAVLEIPDGTVKSRLSRARQALKEKLQRFIQI